MLHIFESLKISDKLNQSTPNISSSEKQFGTFYFIIIFLPFIAVKLS